MDKGTSREIITLQIGKAGVSIGTEFYRDLTDEHRIEYVDEQTAGRYRGDDNFNFGADDGAIWTAHANVFFNEAHENRYVPRSLLVDLNMKDLEYLLKEPIGQLYRPDSIIGNDEGSSNCYAKAFLTEGPGVDEEVLEQVRREVERCHCLQGVQFLHSINGGTGSGLTGLIQKSLHEYLDKGDKCIFQNFTLVPGKEASDFILEPYNAALGVQDLMEYSHQAFFFDNTALGQICKKTLEIDVPRMSELNNIVALCMSGLTSSLRFPGVLNADLRKMHTNLVPFKGMHFLTTGFAPLVAEKSKAYRSPSILDLAQQMMSADCMTLSCDPLNPGNEKTNVPKSRFLASFAAFRGACRTSEIDEVLFDLQKPNSRFDRYFPDWIPSSISSSICSVPHCEKGESVTFVSNTTAVVDVLDRMLMSFDKLYRGKSYLHVYEQHGMGTEDLDDARGVVDYVKNQYVEYANYTDQVTDEAGLSSEQQEIAREVNMLRDAYIATTKQRTR